MVYISAVIFSALIALVVAFQCALIFGAPWGEYAMGGSHPGKYPMKMRIAAAVQAVILFITSLVVLANADLFLPNWKEFSVIAIWFVVTLMALSTILNLITKSKWERRVWAPVTIALLLTSLIVAVF